MEKIPADKVRQSVDELSSFVARQEVVDSLERAAKDKRLLRKAKADSKAFLEAEGHRVPHDAEVKISQQRTAVSGQITICVRVCRRFGPFTVCVQGCLTIAFKA